MHCFSPTFGVRKYAADHSGGPTLAINFFPMKDLKDLSGG